MMNSSSIGIGVLLGWLWLVTISLSAAPKLHVPEGFVVEQVAAEPDIVFPMFAAFDERGRLFVAESSGLDLYKEISALTRKCRIRVLEDPDANGRFRKSRVWADNLVFPMGLAWRDGKLYVADPPDLITLEDSKGSGKADKRTVLLSGFGHRDNGSLHGLVFGPDDHLYLTLGDPDGFKLKQKDGTMLVGTTGGLLRCKADGSEVEALCSGFENLVEIAFTPRGEIIGTDNWFQRPVGGLRDALVHLVPGGRYPRHHKKSAPLPFTGEALPAIAKFPAVALSGLLRYEGAAFPPAMHGNLFAAQHNSRKISRHVLVPDGSSFRTEDHDFVTTDDPDWHPSDVLESTDGSLYVLDTGSWYVHHCPTGQIRKVQAKGGIYRVRWGKAPKIDDPWGLKIDWQQTGTRKLVELLADPRPKIRERARRTLRARGPAAIEGLVLAALGKSKPARVEAMWALAAMPDQEAQNALARFCAERNLDDELLPVAVRGLGLHRARAHEPAVRSLLGAGPAHLRLAAAEALARCGAAASVPALLNLLRENPDRVLEHTVIFALHHHADVKALENALSAAHPRVQQAALILLDQPPRPQGRLKPDAVLQRIASPDAGLRRTALAILQAHKEWSEQARELLRKQLDQPKLSSDEQLGLRSLILAFQGNAKIQDLLAAAVTGKETSTERRVVLLETMAQSELKKMPASWREALAHSLTRPEPEVRGAAVRTAAVSQVAELDYLLEKMASDATLPSSLRLEAQRGVILRRPKLTASQFALLAEQLDKDIDPLARLSAAEILGRAQLSEAQMRHMLKAARDEALVSPAVLLPAFQRSVTEATGPALLDFLGHALKTGWRPSETELNKVLAALPKELQAKAGTVQKAWRESKERQRARLAEFEPLLQGGTAERGRQVFFGTKAACATCHRLGNDGAQIGPDLTKIGAIRAPADILESILLPSSTIAQGYDPYLAMLKNGRVVTGIIVLQSSEILVLRDSAGAELRLPRDQIDELRRTATSLMPEGLERSISREDFRDLLAFLRGLR